MPVIGFRYKEGIPQYDFLHPTLDRRHEVLYYPPGQYDITPPEIDSAITKYLIRIFEDEEDGDDRGELNIHRRETPRVVSSVESTPGSIAPRSKISVSQIQLGPDSKPYIIQSARELRGREEIMVYLVLNWVRSVPANAMTFMRERRQKD